MKEFEVDQIQPYLEAGEQILWAAQPDLRKSIGYDLRRIGQRLALLTALVFASISLVLFMKGYISLFGSPLLRAALACMIGLNLVSILPIWVLLWWIFRWTRAQSVYAITNHALLWIYPSIWPFSNQKILTRRLSLQQAYDLEVVRHSNGFGTLIFLGKWLPTLPRRHVIPRHPKFHAIPDVDRVIAIARQAARQASFEKPTRLPLGERILQILRDEWLLYAIASAMVIVFCFAFVMEVGDKQSILTYLISNERGIIASVLAFLALGGLIWIFRIQETLRRYPDLRHRRIILVLSQVGLFLIALGAMIWGLI